jgi:hypothetical protein
MSHNGILPCWVIGTVLHAALACAHSDRHKRWQDLTSTTPRHQHQHGHVREPSVPFVLLHRFISDSLQPCRRFLP